MTDETNNMRQSVARAVSHYWRTREAQARKQVASGRPDYGARSAVTGGAQMSGFITIITELILRAGLREEYIFYNKSLDRVARILSPDKRVGSTCGKGRATYSRT
jgi:hypothetical protein